MPWWTLLLGTSQSRSICWFTHPLKPRVSRRQGSSASSHWHFSKSFPKAALWMSASQSGRVGDDEVVEAAAVVGPHLLGLMEGISLRSFSNVLLALLWMRNCWGQRPVSLCMSSGTYSGWSQDTPRRRTF